MAAKTLISLGWMFLIGLLIGCQSVPTSLPALTPEQPIFDGQPAHVSLLIGIDAPTYIKREGWIDFQPVGFGALVYSTDLLKTDGQVTLLCTDMRTTEQLSGLGRNPCPPPQNNQALIYDQMWLASGTRDIPPSTIPYILYPRNTVISESHPFLRWNDTGATSYTVEIKSGANIVWQKTNVQGSALEYPADAPQFEAGKDYLLVVTDVDTGQVSTEDPNKGLRFQIVSADQRIELEKQEQIIFNLAGLEPAAQKLALALFYRQVQVNGLGLWGEINRLLAEAAQTRPDSPAIHLFLGDSFYNMKLMADAQTEYKTALTQAQSLNDLESQAEALAALWRINPSNEAQFDQAVNLYEQIGANDKADTLREENKP